MKILIFGDSGNVGTYLMSFLKKNLFIVDGLSTKKCDLSNILDVESYLQSVPYYDTIIFLVGLAHKKGKKKDFKEFEKYNYQTLINILSVLESQNKIPKQIIFSSTISIYGEQYQRVFYKEDVLKEPKSPYAITKLMAEKYLLKNYPKISWILRFSPIYSKDFTLNIERRIKIKNIFFRIGCGNRLLSLCNLENIGILINGIVHNKIPSGYYNIADNKEYTFNDLIKNKKAKYVFYVPRILVYFIYRFGILTDNIFLKENSIKLLTDNVFPVDKIEEFMHLEYNLTENDL